MHRVRFLCDSHTFGLAIWICFEPNDDVVLALTLACFVLEITVVSAAANT
ncbi:MAG TPA: hypothetical protein VGR82_17695 [Methylomirabilota bacterium]|jgi:hypothetical protein|nr:hypothetical protein [Methylomirabilota bacterium]